MIKWIIIFLLISNVALADSTKIPIQWNYRQRINANVILKSSIGQIDKSDLNTINIIYSNSEKLFFAFAAIPKCRLKPLEIRLVSKNEINSPNYFTHISGKHVGRYFRGMNQVYITKDSFVYNEYLAHELAHYFYDQCNIILDTDIEKRNKLEHEQIEKFEYYYLENTLRLE